MSVCEITPVSFILARPVSSHFQISLVLSKPNASLPSFQTYTMFFIQAARRASQYGGRVPPSLASAADPSTSEAAPSGSRHKRRRTSGDGDADRSASASSSSIYNSCEETDRRYSSPIRRRSVRSKLYLFLTKRDGWQ